MHTASTWGEGTFCLDREFSENAPYKQKLIFHLVSSDNMSQKKNFSLGQWISGTSRIFKIKNPSIFEEIRGISVKSEKVLKSDKNSVNDCTPRLIAGG